METTFPVEYVNGTLRVAGETLSDSSKQYQLVLLAIQQKIGHLPRLAKGEIRYGPQGMEYLPQDDLPAPDAR